MKNTNELLETGHGFIVFDSNELVQEDEGEFREPTTSDFTYSNKPRTKQALNYISWKYLVEGVTARELLKTLEYNLEFWEEVRWFHEAEFEFDNCYSCNI